MKKASIIGILLFLGVLGNTAFATTEIPALLDARSVGLGGTGTAYIDNATAIFTNPASLSQIDKCSLDFNFTPFFFKTKIPLTGPDSQVETNTSFAPMMFAGGAYRIHERVVVGLGILTPAGFGIDLDDFPEEGANLESELARFELAVPVSIELTEDLSLGVEWRSTYMQHTIHQYVEAGPELAAMDIDLSGYNFTGFGVGLYYKPTPILQFGFSYRSKVTVDTNGTTKMLGTRMHTTSSWATPDSFRLGMAVNLLEEKLMLAADLKYQLYKHSNKEMVLNTTTPAGIDTVTMNLDWKNTLGLGLGAEYKVDDSFFVRFGYSLTQSAVPNETAGFIGPTPGLFHGIHAGAGWTYGKFDFDAGGYYMFGSKDVDVGTSDNAGPGEYSLSSTVVSTSISYRF